MTRKVTCILTTLLQSLFEQASVRSRMRKFHSAMADLQVSSCITCHERFPGMSVRMSESGTECLRCGRDKHSPKSYSCENNMDPGSVPVELVVSVLVSVVSFTLTCVSSHLIVTGTDPDRGDAHLSSDAYHVSVMGTVGMLSTSPRMLLRVCPAFPLNWMSLLSGMRGPTGTSVSDVQWCSELSSGWSHTTVLPLRHRHHCSEPAPTGWEHLPACVCH